MTTWKTTRLGLSFYKYHDANPKVYRLFKKFTLHMIGAGWKRYSAHAIIHRVRWETDVHTVSDDGLKISNNHFPYYARLFMEDYPDYDGFFVIHELKDEGGASAESAGPAEPPEPVDLFDSSPYKKW